MFTDKDLYRCSGCSRDLTLFSTQGGEDVGGFPTDTRTEDFELDVRMNAAGYVGHSTKSRWLG